MAALAGCGSSNTATTGPAISRCTTAQLEASLGEPRGTGGTTTDYPLNLRNTRASTCTVQGYAGVSFVAGDDNHQIGHAASRDTGSAPTITLSHGQTASATLGIVDAANFPRIATRLPHRTTGVPAGSDRFARDRSRRHRLL
jgi:hypothetical protein